MQRPRVIENSALSAHLQVRLVRWPRAVGAPEDGPGERDTVDRRRRVTAVEPGAEVLYRRNP